jgi:hypothetical protein
LAKGIKGRLEEGEQKMVILNQEDPGLFSYFGEYLYRDGWLGKEEVSRDADYIVLARLYACD